jgi:hypothetical protein
MDVVGTIFVALGGPAKLARGMSENGQPRVPIQTAHSWKAKGIIPKWRRQAVLGLAKRKGAELPPPAVAYLQDTGPAAA